MLLEVIVNRDEFGVACFRYAFGVEAGKILDQSQELYSRTPVASYR